MNIIREKTGPVLTLLLEGKLDTNTAPELDGAIFGSLDGVSELIIDFAKLDYISSAGLRMLLRAHKAMEKRGGMKLVHVNEAVLGIFEMTGFIDFLKVE